MLRIELLGGFHAHVESGEAFALAKQPRRAALLAYLAVEREVPRSRVIPLLWPDVPLERGRHSLNQAIYYLRGIIGADWVELRGDQCVVAAWVTTDVEELERASTAGAHERVLQLYRGALLAGTTLAETVDFEMWVDRRRAAIDRLHRRARRQVLADLMAANRTQDALQIAEEWCRLDPLEDEAQHRYMQLLASVGQRGAALRQYSVYKRLLDEYDLRPLDETVALVDQLQHGEVAVIPATAAPTIALTPLDQNIAARAHTTQNTTALGSTGTAQPAAAELNARAAALSELAARAYVDEPALARAYAEASRREQTKRTPWWLMRRTGLSALLAGVFLVNLLETSVETWLAPRLPAIEQLRLQLARASHWFERGLSFEYHELTNRFAVIGYSVSYFLIFPLLLVAVGVSLAKRDSIRPYRTFSLAVVINYLISLPFFLFFPVPERWYYPETGAMVLSDMWSVHLIESFRTISGLDNSFPSFHVSLTVVLVLSSLMYRQRFRWSVLFLGASIVLATFALGIHWITDLIAGAAAGVLSMLLAIRADATLPDAKRADVATQIKPQVSQPVLVATN